jgi:hypothetical protein
MSAAGSSEPVASLMAALGEAARLLEEGDSDGAVEAMATVAGRCSELAKGGLGSDDVATARQLLERCRQAESRLRHQVAGELARNGTSRRAHAAYER